MWVPLNTPDSSVMLCPRANSVGADVLQAVQKEDHADEEQQVVVAGDHVLGAEVNEGQQVDAAGLFEVGFVVFGYAVGLDVADCHGQHGEQGAQRQHGGAMAL
jgi:hypothetical protein